MNIAPAEVPPDDGKGPPRFGGESHRPPWAAVLESLARRRRLAEVLPRASRLWLAGCLLLALAGGLSLADLPRVALLLLALAGATASLLGVLLLFVAGRRRSDDALLGASLVDRDRHLADLLKSALETPRPEQSSDREAAFRRLLDRRAEEAAESVDPHGAAPLGLPPAFPVGLVLLVGGLLPLLLGGGTTPSSGPRGDSARAQISADRPATPTAGGAESSTEEPAAEELAVVEQEQLADLELRRLEDGTSFEGTELETMDAGELAQLLQELRDDAGVGAPSADSPAAEPRPRADAPTASEPAEPDDGLREVGRSDDPFAGPEQGRPQQGQRSNGEGEDAGAAAAEAEGTEGVQRIELPPMANPNARRSQDGEATAAVAVAGGDPSQAQAPPPDAGQSGAGGGESSGPQGGSENPLGEATDLAVTLELALLEAEEETERPIERSIRHRSSEAQRAEVARTGARSVDTSLDDRRMDRPVLPLVGAERIRRYFDPARWPEEGPSSTASSRPPSR